jgi:NAD(P)-dependent dehydrogenase (short-subunit alcohol dehydrogenase family)
MTIEANGKRVLVTGTSTGIGRATALYLDQLGYNVIGTVRKESDAQSLQEAASARMRTIFLDVTDANSITQFQEALEKELGDGGLWGVVNNAGVGFSSPLEIVPLEKLRWLFEVNLFGLLAVTQVCLPYLRREQGRIVNVSSTASIMGAPFHGPYSSAKRGLNALSDALRLEVRPFGIQVSVIICGAVKTPIWETGGENAGHIWAGQPPEKQALYGLRYGQLGDYFQEIGDKGVPPEEAAQIIASALTSSRAKYTYYVGSDARLYRVFNKVIPDRLRDWIILRTIGIE